MIFGYLHNNLKVNIADYYKFRFTLFVFSSRKWLQLLSNILQDNEVVVSFRIETTLILKSHQIIIESLQKTIDSRLPWAKTM